MSECLSDQEIASGDNFLVGIHKRLNLILQQQTQKPLSYVEAKRESVKLEKTSIKTDHFNLVQGHLVLEASVQHPIDNVLGILIVNEDERRVRPRDKQGDMGNTYTSNKNNIWLKF